MTRDSAFCPSTLSEGKFHEYQSRLKQTEGIARRLGLRCTGCVTHGQGCVVLLGSELIISGALTGPWFQGMVEDACTLAFRPSMEEGRLLLQICFTFDLSAESIGPLPARPQ